ncbi:MAG: MBL fold metallo-hydrolase [Lachnospiraceae bacterium]|nr:MBL fold metallo-hydrolase [Lachnospiraceae bacterium]
MQKIRATIKVPVGFVERYLAILDQKGIEMVESEQVPYEKFCRESRLNYDCVFPQMWEEKQDVSYLHFYFDDTPEGRKASFDLEYDLMQIPLNLRYEDEVLIQKEEEKKLELKKYPAEKRKITRENLIERIQVNDWLYVLNEANSANMYLVIGEKRALLIDAGYGFKDMRGLIEEVTSLPYDVVCTHGHDDHVLGCKWFPKAYLNERDYDLCTSNDNPVQLEKQLASRRPFIPDIDELVGKEEYLLTSLKNCEFCFVKEGDVFDLGGLTLEVFEIPGHTRGSIGLYCKEKKALFSGDTMMKNHILVYAQSLDTSAAPQDYIRALGKLEKLDVELVWPAHGEAPAEGSLIGATREMLIEWAKHADPEEGKSIVPADSVFAKPGSFSYKFTYNGIKLNYNVLHLDQIRTFMQEHEGAVE